MLWSLIKILLFVAVVAALTYGAGYVMENGPDVVVAIAGYKEVHLGPLQAVLLVLAGLAVLWIGFKLVGLLIAFLRFLLGDETALSRYFTRNRERRGFRSLSEALMALSEGEGKTAMAHAAKAEKLLGNPAITTVITAEAAEMMGDRAKAEAAYKRLLTNDKTRFVGIRGIMQQKLAAGDTETALALARKANELKPKNAEMQDTLLKLQAEQHDWKGARKTLSGKLKTGTMPRDLHRRRDAVLAVSEAKDILDAGKSIEAREAAIEAHKLSPDLIPASIMAARAYIEQGKPRNAARVLRKTWEVSPHPELAVVFSEIAPEETPRERLKRFEELTKVQPDHPETRMLLAEINIAAEDFPAARRALGDLVTTNPTARVLSIMAAVERGLGADDAVVRGWLAKAVTAPRGPQWVCGKCHHVEPSWVPICSSCGGFDTLSWTEGPQTELKMPTGSEMLPLVVGKPAPSPEPQPAAEAPVATDAVDDTTTAPRAEVLEPETQK